MNEQPKPLIKLEEGYVLGIKEIDEQHNYFVGLLNEVYNVINKLKGIEQIGHVVDKAISYAGFHFATEEKYFDEFDYEFKEEHEEQHGIISARLGGLKNKFKGNEIAVAEELIDLMEDWLVEHIAVHDKKYVDCFHKHGLT